MTTAPELSVRERIMQHLQARFEAVQEGQEFTCPDGSTATFRFTWDTVTRKPVTKTQLATGNTLALFDPKETKMRETGFTRSHLVVMVEFYSMVHIGDELGTVLNAMLLDVQSIMTLDINCGGLSLDIVEVKSELDIEGPAEKIMAGVIEFHVVYRHRAGNPRLNM